MIITSAFESEPRDGRPEATGARRT